MFKKLSGTNLLLAICGLNAALGGASAGDPAPSGAAEGWKRIERSSRFAREQDVRYDYRPNADPVVKSGEKAAVFAFIVDEVALCLADLNGNGRFNEQWVDAIKVIYLKKGDLYPDPSMWAPLWAPADLENATADNVLRLPVRRNDCHVRFEAGVPVAFRLEPYVVISTAETILNKFGLAQMQEESLAIPFNTIDAKPYPAVIRIRSATNAEEVRSVWRAILSEELGIEMPDKVQRAWERDNVAKWNDKAAEVLVALNQVRGWVGLPLVRPYTVLSYGCWRHARHSAFAKRLGHFEIPGVEGRSQAGAIAAREASGSAQHGAEAVLGLVASVLHRQSFARTALTGVGIGEATERGFSVSATLLPFPIGKDMFRWNGHVVWPANGAVDVPLKFYPETPEPFPGAETATSEGYPISVVLAGLGSRDTWRSLEQISEVKAEMRVGGETGAVIPPLDYFLVTPETMTVSLPNQPWRGPSVAVVPKRSLKANTTYWVKISYTWTPEVNPDPSSADHWGPPERRSKVIGFTTGSK